jgi:uncharacterized peroxidase-related enzyme
MSHIQIIQHHEATDRLKEIYDDLVSKRGKLAEVHKIQSLNPESIVAHMDLYLTVMFGQSPLSRAQREMIAVIVSVSNKCEYCQKHHLEALNNYWKDEVRLENLRADFNAARLNNAELLLCELAKQLTLSPRTSTENIITRLKGEGMSDRAVLDATLVIAYFNFVNRIVLGLDVGTNQEETRGYNY